MLQNLPKIVLDRTTCGKAIKIYVELELIEQMLELQNVDVGLKFLASSVSNEGTFVVLCSKGLCQQHGDKLKGFSEALSGPAGPENSLVGAFQSLLLELASSQLIWGVKEKLFLFRLAYLVHGWVIPPSLVVNVNQTIVHFLPIGNKRIDIAKGAQNICVIGHGDKKQVLALVSYYVVGNLLPIQVIFEGKPKKSLPKEEPVYKAFVHGWHHSDMQCYPLEHINYHATLNLCSICSKSVYSRRLGVFQATEISRD